MGRNKDHCVLNVYGTPAIETLEQAVDVAMDEGAETTSEAVHEIAAAYVGYESPV